MKNRCLLFFIFSLTLLFQSSLVFALKFQLNNKTNIVGKTQIISVPSGENITDLGQKYSVGFLEFMEANPSVNLNRLWSGEKLVVPTRYILPKAAHRGIVINLAELRLYYYPSHEHVVYTYPIGIGRVRSPTPIVRSKIIEKTRNPTWTPTADAHQEAREKGLSLAKRVPPGPDNPLGKYAMRLAVRVYLIHGTNDPSGVGIRSSGGCIRLYPQDIKKLFHMVKIGTPVEIIDQPIKTGWKNNTLYLEAHVPVDFKRHRAQNVLKPVVKVIMPEVKKRHASVNWNKAMLIAERQSGIPTSIGSARNGRV